jgi:molecular chaperone DnaK
VANSPVDPIVGIDLGTSNCVVAHCDDTGHVKVLVDPAGYKVHPSMVSFHPNGSVVVGAHAKQRRIIDPQHTVYSAKRLIGRSYNAPEVQTSKQRMPYQIKEGPNQSPIIVTRGGEFAVPEISAIVLDHVRDIAATALEAGVNRAVITVPASFNDAQRSATATAGAIAGITVVRVLNEPTAAALAYGHSRPMQEVFAVYDFGGGTFDVTILRLRDQVYEVLGTAGDSFLGGDDLDERLVERMVERFMKDNRVDLRDNEIAMMRMRAVAEQAKIELSRRTRANIKIDEIAYGANGAVLNLHMEVSRDEFVECAASVIERTFPVCDEALKIAGMGVGTIGEVILVGGTTKMPYVRDKVARYFGQGPRTDANPEEAVAMGASLQAVALQRILTRTKPMTARVGTGSLRGPATTDEETQTGTFDGVTVEVTDRQPSNEGRMRPATERPVARGTTVDKFFEEPPTTTTAASLARITRPGTAPPPGLPAFPPGMSPTPPTTTRAASVPPIPALPKSAAATANELVTQPSMEPANPVAEVRSPRPRAASIPPIPPAPQPSATTRPRSITVPPLMAAPVIREEFELPAIQVASATQPTLLDYRPDAPAITQRGVAAAPAAMSPTFVFDAVPAPSVAGVPGTTTPPPMSSVPLLVPIMAPQPAVVIDVVPHSFGIATVGGYCEEIIRRNTRLPVESKKIFSTSRDKQEVVRIRVCQGQSRRLDENIVLGDLVLNRLPQRLRSESCIEVTFAIDASGMLRVHARDTVSGFEQRASIDIIGAMSSDDVQASRERMRAIRPR